LPIFIFNHLAEVIIQNDLEMRNTVTPKEGVTWG